MGAVSAKEERASALRRYFFRLSVGIRHVGRDRTGRAWLVGAFATLLYVIVRQDEVRNILLAFLGVTITFIVLPDIKHDVRAAVEQSNLLIAEPELLASRLTPAVAEHVAEAVVRGLAEQRESDNRLGLDPRSVTWPYQFGAAPLLGLWDEPRRLVLDQDYSIRMRVMGDEFPTLYSVTAVSHNRQLLPVSSPGQFVISFCRTPQSFVNEFSNPMCIGRNLVDVNAPTWQRLCSDPQLYFGVAVSGQLDDGTELVVGSDARPGCEVDGDVLRFNQAVLPGIDLATTRVKYHEELSYPFPARYRTFTAKFASYFCGGNTNLNFEIEDPQVSALTLVNYMSSVGDYRAPHYQEPEHRTARGGRAKATGLSYSNRLFWPGSGVVYIWERDRDEFGQ